MAALDGEGKPRPLLQPVHAIPLPRDVNLEVARAAAVVLKMDDELLPVRVWRWFEHGRAAFAFYFLHGLHRHLLPP